ncbi:hypothetical protein JCM10908_003671 [Rhodotorula pacifica]|uniref:uncharacterized protein n=1 Tax=Rhodotorula pacifica TaxID=1495444 RepID=UPI0031743EAB
MYDTQRLDSSVATGRGDGLWRSSRASSPSSTDFSPTSRVWNRHLEPPQIRLNDLPPSDSDDLFLPPGRSKPHSSFQSSIYGSVGSSPAVLVETQLDKGNGPANSKGAGHRNVSTRRVDENDAADRLIDVETRLAQVTGLTNELKRRLLLLEEAVYSRDREIADLRAALRGRQPPLEQDLVDLSDRLGRSSRHAQQDETGAATAKGAGAWWPADFTPPSSPESLRRSRSSTVSARPSMPRSEALPSSYSYFESVPTTTAYGSDWGLVESSVATPGGFNRARGAPLEWLGSHGHAVQQTSQLSITSRSSYGSLLDLTSDFDAEAYVKRLLKHNDQQCSLFLQQKVKTAEPEQQQAIFTAVEAHLRELACSKFGNFLVSRCLETGDAALAHAYAEKLRGTFLQICLDPFGCHVAQRLIDSGGESIKQAILEELMPHKETLLCRNACHVWNRLLAMPNPPSLYQHLVELGAGSWSTIVQDDGGSLIAQRILQQWDGALNSVLVQELAESVVELSRFSSGCSVLSHLIERDVSDVNAKIAQHILDFSQHSQGARLVDKCVRAGKVPQATLQAFVESATSSHDPPLLKIMRHASGAQLVLTLLSGVALDASLKGQIVNCIRQHEQELARYGGPQAVKVMAYAKRLRI